MTGKAGNGVLRTNTERVRHRLTTPCQRQSKQAGRPRKGVMVDTADPVSNLRDLGDSIDNIDAAIIHMLAERFRCTRAIGKLKAHHGLPSRDPAREAEQASRLRHLAAVSSSTQTLPRSSWPWSFVKSSDITNWFRAQLQKVSLRVR